MSTSFARREAYLSNARATGKGFRALVEFVGAAVVVIVVLSLVPHIPARELLVGIAIGAAAMLVLLTCARVGDWNMRGHLAEQFSLEAFRKVRGWLVVDNLSFIDYDVDHVVTTPAGVLAVESKFRSRIPDYDDARRHQRELGNAQRGAERITKFLASKKITDVPVVPVLMVWGPGAPVLDRGFRMDGPVYLLDGDERKLWTYVFNEPAITTVQAQAAHQTLLDYQQTRVRHDAEKKPALRPELWAAFRGGVREARDERRAKKKLAQSLKALKALKTTSGSPEDMQVSVGNRGGNE